MSWEIFWIIIVISIIIFITKKWGENIKKIFKTSRPTKISAQTSNNTPNAGNTNPPPTDHANSAKSKTNWFSKIFWFIATIILIVATLVFLAWALPFIKKGATDFFKPSPKYKRVILYDRTVTINLNSDWNETNTIYLNKGEKFTFKEATVSFCVKNKGNQIVCGPPNSDPNLPSDAGELNLKLWFKSEYGETGTIKVDVFRRERKRVK